MRDFSIKKLEKLFARLIELNYQILRFDDYWQNQEYYDKQEKVVLLRHDVDRFPITALKTAIMENKLGIHGTYFFRVKKHTYKSDIIKRIESLGHEIGYHYECLADTKGDFTKAEVLFRTNLSMLREKFKIESLSMHSRPLSKWDNRLLWKRYQIENYDILGEVYQDIDHDRYLYLADSGRNWGGDRNVVYDYVNGKNAPSISSTDELISILDEMFFNKLHLLIHPNRWNVSMIGWICQLCLDQGINLAKKIVKIIIKPYQ